MPGALLRILRLVAERIRHPVLAVVRSLKFDFVAAARHGRKQSVPIGDAKWFQSDDRAQLAAEPRGHSIQSSRVVLA